MGQRDQCQNDPEEAAAGGGVAAGPEHTVFSAVSSGLGLGVCFRTVTEEAAETHHGNDTLNIRLIYAA